MARQITIIKDDNNNAIDLYKIVMQATPQGMSLDEMRNRLAILDKMDNEADELILEDAEWSILSNAIKSHQWPQVHPFIPLACDEVLNAKEYDFNDAVEAV